MCTYASIYHINNIIKCLRVAGKYEGRLFGGFIRDVSIPRMYNPACFATFKDVDIWFTSTDKMNGFINEIKEFGYELFPEHIYTKCKCSKDTLSLKHECYHYYLYHHEKQICVLDITVSKTIPVNDLNISLLTFCYNLENDKVKMESFGDDKVETLIHSINNKYATILPEYYEKLCDININVNGESIKIMNRLNDKYLSKGWKVYYKSKFPTSVNSEWITYYLNHENENENEYMNGNLLSKL
jgi:hypothetical protein